MAKYENGKSTKEQIMVSATRLFYQKGFSDTTLDEVASDSHVAKDSILYHFGSKDGLFDQSGNQAFADFFSQVDAPWQGTNIELFIQSYMYWYKFFRDPAFRQYCVESMDRSSPAEEYVSATYSLLKQAYGLTQTYEEFAVRGRLIFELASSAETVLVHYYAEHLHTSTFRQAAELEMEVYSRLFGIPEDLIQSRLSEAREAISKMDLEQMTGFGGGRAENEPSKAAHTEINFQMNRNMLY